MAFVFSIVVFCIDYYMCRGYLISIAYCPFFHFVGFVMRRLKLYISSRCHIQQTKRHGHRCNRAVTNQFQMVLRHNLVPVPTKPKQIYRTDLLAHRNNTQRQIQIQTHYTGLSLAHLSNYSSCVPSVYYWMRRQTIF